MNDLIKQILVEYTIDTIEIDPDGTIALSVAKNPPTCTPSVWTNEPLTNEYGYTYTVSQPCDYIKVGTDSFYR